MYNQKPVNSQIEQGDLNSFKNYVIILIISMLVPLVTGVISSSLGPFIKVIGYAAFAYGIYVLSKKYDFLNSGMKVVYLFLLIIVLQIISIVISLAIPQPILLSSADITNYLNNLSSYLPFLFVNLLISVLISIVLLFATYYFTQWFNEELTPFNQTQAFWYYGILNVIGTILLGITSYLSLNALANSSSNLTATVAPTSTVPVSTALSSNLVGLVFVVLAGAIVGLAAFIMEIVAGVKIYNRVTDIATGKIYFRNQPYGQPAYGQPPYGQPAYSQQPPNQSYGQQSFSQQPPNNQTQTFTQETSSSQTGTKFCRNCGSKLEENVTFCQNCGTRV